MQREIANATMTVKTNDNEDKKKITKDWMTMKKKGGESKNKLIKKKLFKRFELSLLPLEYY